MTDSSGIRLADLIGQGDSDQLAAYLTSLDSHSLAREVCELTDKDQAAMLTSLDPTTAVDVLDDIPDVEAVEAVSLLAPETAAAIVNQLPSDEQADLVGSLDDEDAAAILALMEPAEAEQIAKLVEYPTDTAGGLMATEVFAFQSSATAAQVLRRLRKNARQFRRLDVQYAYVTDISRCLVGVLQLRDLILADDQSQLVDLMRKDPIAVRADASLAELRELFDDHTFFGVPVIDEAGCLVGVVSRTAVDEATQDQAISDYRRSLGLVEEEIRAMPTLRRSRLRLSWLSINVVLNVVAASVIACYQDTLSQVIALAVFLPIISDMSGCSGNQAVAVSMRELALGLIEPFELRRVWIKEVTIGSLNGLALGGLLGGIAWIFSGNFWLAFVVGIALACNTLIAVLIGGSLPLALKRRGVDPALASGPILTTVTDMFGFFLVLSIATLLLPRLAGG